MSDRIVSMSSSIGEWLLPGYSLNLAPRDPQCHVAGRFNTSAWITGAIHYQTGRLNRWKNRADIDLAVHNLIGAHRRRACCRAHVTTQCFDERRLCIATQTCSRPGEVIKGRPLVVDSCHHFIMLFPCLSPRMIRRRNPAGLRAPDEKRIYPLLAPLPPLKSLSARFRAAD